MFVSISSERATAVVPGDRPATTALSGRRSVYEADPPPTASAGSVVHLGAKSTLPDQSPKPNEEVVGCYRLERCANWIRSRDDPSRRPTFRM